MKFNSTEASDKFKSTPSYPKVIEPGTQIVRVLDMQYKPSQFTDKMGRVQYDIEISVESLPLGESFVGLQIDRHNPAAGNYDGQIGQVRATKFPFNVFTTSRGETLEIDAQVFRWLTLFANAIGLKETLAAAALTADTIEEYFDLVKPYLVDRDRWIWMTIAAEEYDKDGYTRYRLMLPKMTKEDGTRMPFGVVALDANKAPIVDQIPDTVIVYNAAEERFLKKKAAPTTVAGFDASAGVGLGAPLGAAPMSAAPAATAAAPFGLLP